MGSVEIKKNYKHPNTFKKKLAIEDKESFKIVREITLKNFMEIKKEIKKSRKIFFKRIKT